MTSPKGALTIAQRCKNILAGNYQAILNTVKADAERSKGDLHSSRVKYLFRRGKPYIWIPEGDAHNVNTVIDERGPLAVASTVPGPLVNLLRSLGKLPAHVALTGDVLPITDDKATDFEINHPVIAQDAVTYTFTLGQTKCNMWFWDSVKLASDSLREAVQLEQKVLNQSSYAVSGVLCSSTVKCKTRSSNLSEILDGNDNYIIYKFNLRSCTLMDIDGRTHEVELKDVLSCKADPLSPFSESLIDGINQSQARRRALMLFCFVYLNTIARDTFLLSVDQNGFDVFARVPSLTTKDGGSGQYQWKEFRFHLKEEAHSIEEFCCSLVEMEEEALKTVSSYSGLG